MREGDAFLRACWLHGDAGREDEASLLPTASPRLLPRGIEERRWFKRREDLVVIAYLCGESPIGAWETQRRPVAGAEQAVAWSSGLQHLQELVELAERQGREPRDVWFRGAPSRPLAVKSRDAFCSTLARLAATHHGMTHRNPHDPSFRDWIAGLADRVLEGGAVTPDEARRMLEAHGVDSFDLFAAANRIREAFQGADIHLCSIVNAKSAGAARTADSAASPPTSRRPSPSTSS